jgi:hypothetical protein
MENRNRRQNKKQTQTQKCFSKCRKVPKKDCTQEQCIYINGKRFQYCRLSHKYYLDEECNAHVKSQTRKRRIPNKPSSSIIQSLPAPPNSLIEKELAGIKIKNFIMTKRKQAREKLHLKAQINISKALHKGHIQSKNLQVLCSDSSICIAFGKQAKEISDFFNRFKKFDYVELPVIRIGAPSVNGFIHEIKYSRLNYNAYAILKSSAKETADNLYYEYQVGKYINVVNKFLPSFIETYGLFQYKDEVTYNNFKNTKIIRTNVLTDAFMEKTPTLEDACINPKHMCMLIQHIKNAQTLSMYSLDLTFIKQDLIYILFQVYASLYALTNSFTHYDLHDNNVLLYKPVDSKYIEYHYHYKNNKVISFKSQYIAKIIDYGRCYYKLSETDNSLKLHENICRTRECDPKCGEDVGFNALQYESVPPRFSYTEAVNPNQSHDLRLLNTIKEEWFLKRNNPEIYSIVKKVVYGKGLRPNKKSFGTRQELNSGLPNKINNISDAYTTIMTTITNPMNIGLNNRFYSDVYGFTKLGDLHIYVDGSQRPMHYEEA